MIGLGGNSSWQRKGFLRVLAVSSQVFVASAEIGGALLGCADLWQLHYSVNLKVQISWQAHRFVNVTDFAAGVACSAL